MTDKKRRGLDLALCLGAGLFYLLNVHVLRGSVGGAIEWFLACYANDVVAGLAICAWLDLLLSLGRLPPFSSCAPWCGRSWPLCGNRRRWGTPGTCWPIRRAAWCGWRSAASKFKGKGENSVPPSRRRDAQLVKKSLLR